MTVQGNFTIGSAATYTPGTNTTYFTGGSNQLFINNNTAPLSLYNLTVDKTAGTVQLSGAATSLTVANTLTLSSGVFADGGKTVYVQGNIYNGATHVSTGGPGSITLSGTALQTISGNGIGVFGNLAINNTGVGDGNTAAKLTAAQSIAGTLTLTSNTILDIDTYKLSMTDVGTATLLAGAGGFSVDRMIQTSGKQSDGGLSKTFGSYGPGSGFTYAVGVAGKYTPATITLNTAPVSYGQISVSPANAKQPFVTSSNALKHYWKLRSTGFGTLNATGVTLSFSDSNINANAAIGDVVGGTPDNTNPTNYVPGRYSTSTASWSTTGNTAQVTENAPTGPLVISFPNIGAIDGEYTAGDPSAFLLVTAFYSRTTGNWESNTTWSYTSHSGAAVPAGTTAGINFPGPTNPVFIGDAGVNHVVTVTGVVGASTGVAASSGSLVIASGSVLDVQTITGNNFGALPDAIAGGEGTLRISTSTTTAEFPKGDFGTFIGPLGGTVEYYGTGSTNFTVPSVSQSGVNLITYNNLILNAITTTSARTITLPNTNLRIYNTFRTGTGSAYTGIVQTESSNTGTTVQLTVDGQMSIERGTFRYNNPTISATNIRSIVANGDIVVNNTATFTATGAGTLNTLLASGNITNNGTIDFSAGGKVALTFTGSSNKSLTGTNGTAATTLSTLTLDKGTSPSSILTVDVAGTLTTPTSGWLTLTHGTFRFAKASGSLTINSLNSAYIVPEEAGLTMDASGGTLNVVNYNSGNATTNVADLQLAGLLKVVQGTVNVGLTTNLYGNDIEYAGAGSPMIEVTGGNLNVNGKIRRGLITTLGALRYNQTGGRVDVYGASATTTPDRSEFEILNDGSAFRMSGGVLALHGSSANTLLGDLYLRPDTVSVTGGTVALGDNAATTNLTIGVDTNVPLYNLRVEYRASGTNTTTGILRSLPLTLLGSLQIGDATLGQPTRSIFDANGLDLTIGQDLMNYNTLATTATTTGGFRPGSATQTTTFNGSGNAQNILGVGSGASANITAFANLVVNNTSGTVTLDGTTGRNIYVNGLLTLTNGTLNDNGRTITVIGNVSNSATHTGSGKLLLAGTVNQVLSGNDAGKFGNLEINNAAGATTTADQEITGTLTFNATTSGLLDIGSQLLYLSNSAVTSVVGVTSSRYIRTNGLVADQGVRRAFPTGASSFLFPVGVTGGKYTPAQFSVTANSAAGTITVRPIDTVHPATTNATTPSSSNALKYYWKVSSTGFSNPTVTQSYTYSASDVQGGPEASYVPARFVNDDWSPQGGFSSPTGTVVSPVITLNGVSFLDGDYTAGLPTEFLHVPTLYSRNSTAGTAGGGNWNSPTTWTYDPTGADPVGAFTLIPTSANPTVILAGHLVNATAGNLGTERLTLNGTLDLKTFTANNFNTVTGTGTLRIGSDVFPAGNYDAFVTASTGGTVDYSGAVVLPARDTYNNLRLSGGNSKSLSNLSLTVNGQFTVDASTTATNANSQSITLTSSTLGVLQNGTLVMNDGSLTVPAGLVNTGTLSFGTGTVTIGKSLASTSASVTNSGVITAGSGAFTLGTSFVNSGTFTAGTGALTVPGTFTNTGTYTAASNLLTVSGNFFNGPGTFTAGSSKLDLYGNFTNTGTFNTTGGTSLVRLLGTGNRTLTGNTTFYDLTKLTTGGNILLGTASDITVSHLLTLNSGKVITGTSNTLYLTNSTTETPLVGTNSSVYVQGRLAITFPNTANAVRTFAVGNGGFYRPVTIRQTSTSVNPQVLVEVINSRPSGSVNTPLTNLSHIRYYRIHLLSGTINNPIIQLSFNNDGQSDEPAFVPGNLRIAKKNSGSPSIAPSGTWSNEGGSGAFSPSSPAGIVTSASSPYSTINSDSFFALASTNVTDNPLPVELTKFTAEVSGPAVQLAWTTATEKNSAYFEVQRSANGVAFETLTQVTAQGSSSRLQDYAHRDNQPLAGKSYYRLKLVDQDGSFTYSRVAAVSFSASSSALAASVTLYPNPSNGESFRLSSLNVPAGPASVKVFDLQGRLISEHKVDFSQADVAVTPAQKLATGTYLVTVQTSAGRFTHRLVVE